MMDLIGFNEGFDEKGVVVEKSIILCLFFFVGVKEGNVIGLMEFF